MKQLNGTASPGALRPFHHFYFPLSNLYKLALYISLACLAPSSPVKFLRQGKLPLNSNLIRFIAGRETNFGFSEISTAEASVFKIYCPELTFTLFYVPATPSEVWFTQAVQNLLPTSLRALCLKGKMSCASLCGRKHWYSQMDSLGKTVEWRARQFLRNLCGWQVHSPVHVPSNCVSMEL